MNRNLVISSFSLAVLFAGCATSPVSVTTEHKGTVTLVHHRRRVGNGAVDHIEAIAPNGTVSQAEIHVYDLGRLPDGKGGMHEAHRYYRVVQDAHLNTNLPSRVSSGPKPVFTPPNYTPTPKDQRVTDAVAEAKEAKDTLEQERAKLQQQIAKDNNLRGQLNDEISDAQRVQDQLSAAMNTPRRAPKPAPESDAQKAAENVTTTTDLQRWGQTVGPNQ